jgi:thymidylate synthase
MKTYLDSLQYILDNGETRGDRTGVGTIGVFGMQQRYDLTKGFPAVTTKKLAFKSCLSELLWFIEGSGDERRLAEILHGTRDLEKKTIWTANALSDEWQDRKQVIPKTPGVDVLVNGTYGEVTDEITAPDYDLGRVYGVQWRSWRRSIEFASYSQFENTAQEFKRVPNPDYHVDQLSNLIEGIKKDPNGRRHILSAWNPGELEQMALPPCHCFAQFYVSANGKLSCQMYQRSCDMFLGVPFNIASYSLLTHMIAQCCDLDVGELIHTLGDAHIYTNHVDAVREQLTRTPKASPTLWLNPDIKDIDKFTMSDVKLQDYDPMDSIKAEMAV